MERGERKDWAWMREHQGERGGDSVAVITQVFIVINFAIS